MKPPPLAHVVLAQSRQDVRHCMACDQCRELHADGMDLTFGEILRYAAANDERSIVCDSLWRCEPLLGESLRCPSGIDVTAVIHTLRREALRRGYYPISGIPDVIQ